MSVSISCNICRRSADEDSPHSLRMELLDCEEGDYPCAVFRYGDCVCGHRLRHHLVGMHPGCGSLGCKCMAPELPE